MIVYFPQGWGVSYSRRCVGDSRRAGSPAAEAVDDGHNEETLEQHGWGARPFGVAALGLAWTDRRRAHMEGVDQEVDHGS